MLHAAAAGSSQGHQAEKGERQEKGDIQAHLSQLCHLGQRCLHLSIHGLLRRHLLLLVPQVGHCSREGGQSKQVGRERERAKWDCQ